MKNEQFNQKTPEDQVQFSVEKQKIIDGLLDQLSEHQKEMQKLEGQLIKITADDEENKLSTPANEKAINNSVMSRIQEERSIISGIQSQIKDQTER